MPEIERRSHIRKHIRMPCSVVFSSGATIFGYTSNVCLEGIAVESSMNLRNLENSISVGESGLLLITYSNNRQEEKIRLRCQVKHLSGNGFGLTIRFYELTPGDQEILGTMIASGSANI